ncbi:MAG: DUF2158 domain-containing protein [Hyphomicrobiales bacterium]
MIINPKVGDRVRAKSGGPVMTVTSVEHDVYGEACVVCDWQDDAKMPASGTFTLSELVKA